MSKEKKDKLFDTLFAEDKKVVELVQLEKAIRLYEHVGRSLESQYLKAVRTSNRKESTRLYELIMHNQELLTKLEELYWNKKTG